FAALQSAHLVSSYEAHSEFTLGPGMRCRALPVRHDGGPTFGFRFDCPRDLFGITPSLGFLTDLGTWDTTLVEHLAEVDILGLEFNHDVDLEYRSGRPHHLVARVLGDEGHLSNAQAAEFLAAVLKRSTPGKVKHVVQLHLSRDCNRPM